MKSNFLVIFFLVFSFGVVSGFVRPALTSAQETPATASAQPPETVLPTPPSIAQELATLNQTYRGQLAEYREAERAYQIAAQQYLQLNTLVSLESALQTMKKVMILRDQVLITYLTIIQIQLRNTTGINLTEKERLVAAITNQLINNRVHLQAAQDAETRDQIVAVATSFTDIGKTDEEIAYQVQTMIATGRLQTVYDKSTTLADDIDRNLVVTTVDVKQGERQRAMTEVRSTLGRAKGGIDELLEKQSTSASRNSFQSALRSLNEIYGDLSQVLQYLDELLRL